LAVSDPACWGAGRLAGLAVLRQAPYLLGNVAAVAAEPNLPRLTARGIDASCPAIAGSSRLGLGAGRQSKAVFTD